MNQNNLPLCVLCFCITLFITSSSAESEKSCEDAAALRSRRPVEAPSGSEPWTRVARRLDQDPILKREMHERKKRHDSRTSSSPFTFERPEFHCDVSEQSAPPTSVHELSPHHVDVVAAMGDSITHGYGVGAERFISVFTGNRGESWSIGGHLSLDEGVITLPNILRKFNPDLKGYSLCHSPRLSEAAWLNVAEGGATSRNMPEQAEDIVDICLSDPSIDNEHDWKVITLLVGGNDLCDSCYNAKHDAQAYARNIELALDILHKHLPKAFVNVVPMFDISPLRNFSKGVLCRFVQPIACRCAMGKDAGHLRQTQLEYYEKLKELVNSGKYDTRGDFTAVIQPMFVNLVPPTNDAGIPYQSFLSYDCFHPSTMAHQAFAYTLWNTMMIPVDEKPLSWDWREKSHEYICPSKETPYFATRLNGDMVEDVGYIRY